LRRDCPAHFVRRVAARQSVLPAGDAPGTRSVLVGNPNPLSGTVTIAHCLLHHKRGGILCRDKVEYFSPAGRKFLLPTPRISGKYAETREGVQPALPAKILHSLCAADILLQIQQERNF
jgi:hypothetical protein